MVASDQSSPRITLPQLVAGILTDFGVPVPTGTIRVTASARSGRKVPAESLSRLAASQREAFLRTRRPPLLCHALAPSSLALKPRVWALGDWRLGRRIITADSEPGLRAAWAAGLLAELERAEPPEDLVRTALHAAAALLGPQGGYRPESEAEWTELRRQVARHLPQAGVDTLTGEQREAELRLGEAAPVVAYFGRSIEEERPGSSGVPLLRLPGAGEEGEAFDRVLRRRLGGDPEQHSIAVAYLQGFSFVLDELGRAPSSEEFADFWRFDLPSVRRDEAVFARAFPEERGPERILRMLEEGLPRQGALRALLETAVIDPAPPPGEIAPAPGQRWVSPGGEDVLTLIEVDGGRLVGGQHQRQSGTTTLWVGSRADLADWHLLGPESVWRVRFDVDVVPASLTGPLHEAGVVVDRMMRPAAPRPGQPVLKAGSVEGHLEAETEGEARRKVLASLKGITSIEPADILVRPLPSRIAVSGRE